MKKVLKKILPTAFAVLFLYGSALAGSFVYSSQNDSKWVNQEVFSKWNPSDPKNVHSPGLKILFFGYAEECGKETRNGPVTSRGNVHFQDAKQLTGIPLGRNKVQRWTPSADMHGCPVTSRNQVGDSFVHINTDESSAGIGLFTHSGNGIVGNDSFFRAIGKKGVNDQGTNAGIEGVFVIFKLDDDADTVRPWLRGSDDKPSGSDAEFSVVQTLASYNVPSERAQNAKGHAQAKQQFVIGLENKYCSKSDGKNKICKIKFLFNTALFRGGVLDWSKEKWFREGGVFLDSAQGGLPIVHGPIKGVGQITKDKKTGLELYKSEAEPTQHQIFFDKQFKVRITFRNFLNSLKITTSLSNSVGIHEVNEVDLVRLFGEKWNDPHEWYVTSVNFSQEVHNVSESSEVYLGGAIKDIYVGASR